MSRNRVGAVKKKKQRKEETGLEIPQLDQIIKYCASSLKKNDI